MLDRTQDGMTMHALRLMQARVGGQITDGKLVPIGPYLSALLPLEPAANLQRRWHVVQTEPQQEAKVVIELRGSKFDVFFPREPKRVRVNPMRHRTINRPMLIGYVFAGFDASSERWQSIIDMRGVLRVLMVGERPVPIPEAVINHLRQREIELNGGDGRSSKGPPITLDAGSFVRILEPFAFSGLFGTVDRIDQENRKMDVEIDIFGRKVSLQMTPEQVEPL